MKHLTDLIKEEQDRFRQLGDYHEVDGEDSFDPPSLKDIEAWLTESYKRVATITAEAMSFDPDVKWNETAKKYDGWNAALHAQQEKRKEFIGT